MLDGVNDKWTGPIPALRERPSLPFGVQANRSLQFLSCSSIVR